MQCHKDTRVRVNLLASASELNSLRVQIKPPASTSGCGSAHECERYHSPSYYVLAVAESFKSVRMRPEFEFKPGAPCESESIDPESPDCLGNFIT